MIKSIFNQDFLLYQLLSIPYALTLAPYFFLLGLLVVLYVFLKVILFATSHFRLKSIDWQKVSAKGSGWAVISGATDGIGLEFARQLHEQGINVLLLGRSPEKLQVAIKSIQIKSSNAQLESYTVDLIDPNWEKLDKEALKGKRITILVNCAGVSHEHPKYFSEESTETFDRIIAVNCSSVLKLTHLILPSMLENNFGIIWNIGSMSAELSSPLLQTYAASKGFLKSWSLALATEVAEFGVKVELLNTHYVATKMSKIKKTSWIVVSPSSYVKAVLSGLGGPFRTPVFSHDLVYQMVQFLSPPILNKVTLNIMTGIRQAAIKKAKKV